MVSPYIYLFVFSAGTTKEAFGCRRTKERSYKRGNGGRGYWIKKTFLNDINHPVTEHYHSFAILTKPIMVFGVSSYFSLGISSNVVVYLLSKCMLWCAFVPLCHLFSTHVAKPTQMGIYVWTIIQQDVEARQARCKNQGKLVWITSICISQYSSIGINMFGNEKSFAVFLKHFEISELIWERFWQHLNWKNARIMSISARENRWAL